MGVLNDSKIVHPLHPYYPPGIEIAGYLANEYTVPQLLGIFSAGCVAILSATRIVVKTLNPGLSTSELVTIMWFVLCGCIHLFFEGYYVYNHQNMGGLQTIFGQLWKEYAYSDSRYLTKDAFVLCMETITAISWGPLSFVVAALITTSSPFRHPFQIIVSLGQLYGDILYYATNLFDHMVFKVSYCRPEAYYFWGYYVFMNIFWIIIPTLLIYSSVTKIARAMSVLDRMDWTLASAGVESKKSQ